MRGLPIEVRLWNSVDVGDCWVWTGRFNTYGYGRLKVDGRTRLTHRLAWEILVGPIPEGMTLDHLCRVRACVNPDHMEVVTNAENILRGYSPSAINARRSECKFGHPFDEANTKLFRGKRNCRICANRMYRERYYASRGRALGEPEPRKTHCIHGHEFTFENTYENPKNGRRQCRTCRRLQQRAAA